MLLNGPLRPKSSKKFSINYSDQLRTDFANAEETSQLSLDHKSALPGLKDGADVSGTNDGNNLETLQLRPKMFRNRFLNFVRLGSVLNNAAESFFKSEIRRRLFVTAVLLVVSRIGYFVPLPGFDRRLIPKDYLSFASGSVGKYHICVLACVYVHIRFLRSI